MNEKTFDMGEVTLHIYENATAAPPLVLLHGLTGRAQHALDVMSALQADWHIYAPDLRGHGKSGRAADNAYDIGAYSRDLIAFLKLLGEPAVLVGHSLGALTAIGAAAGYPAGVRAAVLLDPPLYTASEPVSIDRGTRQWFQWVYDLKSSDPSYEEILAQSRQMMPGADEQVVNALADTLVGVAPGTVQAVLERRFWGALDLGECLRSIQCPTLMIHGDWEAGAAVREQDVALFKANLPKATVVRIAGAGHNIPGEHADVVIREMNALLRQA